MPNPTSVGVPTARSMGGAFGDYGIGIVGGVVYNLIGDLFGSGLIGSLAAPIIASSVVKGTRGTVLATIAGFAAGQELLGGLNLGKPAATNSRGVM